MRRFALSSPWRIRFVVLLLTTLPSAAHAHIQVKQLDGFGDGLLHLWNTPMHLLVIIALGLMAGRQPLREVVAPFWIFFAVSAVATVVTNLGWVNPVYPWVFVLLALCVGALLALEKIPPVPVTCVLFGCSALALGLDSAVEAEIKSWIAKWQLGNWISVNLLFFDLAFYVALGAKEKWMKIALRVAGSWLMAISLMVLAFSFRK